MNKNFCSILSLISTLFITFGCDSNQRFSLKEHHENDAGNFVSVKKPEKEEKPAPELGYAAAQPSPAPSVPDGAIIPPLVPVIPVVIDAEQPPKDSDSDGVPDREDNCVQVSNPRQQDSDEDGFGEGCDCDDDYAQKPQIQGTARYVGLVNATDTANDCREIEKPCKTIRYALGQANPGDTLVLAQITFSERGLVLDKDIFIIGGGPQKTIVDGQFLDRIFLINSGVKASFCGIAIHRGAREGSGEKGGGIVVSNTAKVELLNTIISNNKADLGGGIENQGELIVRNSQIISNTSNFGGGIYNEANTVAVINSLIENNEATFGSGIENINSTVNLNNSTFKNNKATFGGALDSSGGQISISGTTFEDNQAVFGGGIENNSATMSIVNSTLSANKATFGGGVDNFSSGLVISNSTLSENSAIANGGGIKNLGTIIMSHTIVAKNLPGNDCGSTGTLISQGYNLESATSCHFNQTGDLQNANAGLLPLKDYGGPTFTYALGEQSDAIDSGSTDCGVGVDQRGKKRPVDFIGISPDGGQAHCDIGAFERQK